MATKRNSYRRSTNKRQKGSSVSREATKRKKTSSSSGGFKLDLSFLEDKRFKTSAGLLLFVFSVFLCLSLVSYLFTGKADQSVVESTSFGGLIVSGKEVQNWLGLAGAGLSHLFIYEWFGIASIMIVPPLFALGYETVFGKNIMPIGKTFKIVIFLMFWISLLLGYIVQKSVEPGSLNFLCGGIGLRSAEVFDSLVGWGTMFFLIFSMGVFLIYFIRKEVLENMRTASVNIREKTASIINRGEDDEDYEEDEEENEVRVTSPKTETQDIIIEENPTLNPSRALETGHKQLPENPIEADKNHPIPGKSLPLSVKPSQIETREQEHLQEPSFSVEDKTKFREKTVEDVPNKKRGEQLSIDDLDLYDPRLDLSNYEFPKLDLLNPNSGGKVKVTTEELQSNKDKIVETLNNFKIGISSIRATIGPTVTLYEIVPDAGIKISRIKNLEDDIALNLAALGIRIIAPIPGKGTIGIEVPNKNREMVGIRSLLSTEKFMKSTKELPIAIGKTISNEVFITDLAKMPHLLMAGATGQGKSVGLNVILASLIFKKHPAELKFVLVDPKKVELTLFNQIENHFLATLPDAEESIVTDTRKVVNVLNSLCVEMDTRYNLLKDAGARNIKEYNRKFVNRRLNPEKGHRFLPYIVLVIDELADLMMTAGKEVEMPIARLAQLARAIGIHLIIATQRPSVDVITGIIKANFPARMSFKVSSKIDSRTILDTGGADQLVGMGDMLLSNSSDIIRLQCAFVDTEEVENVCNFVGNQQGYSTPYLLPEVETEEKDPTKVDLKNRDDLFDDAARLIVAHQQGSTSLVQRKLSLGYNRAGRIIDQLEAAGIVGPFEGSKARQVLVLDLEELELILKSLN